MASLLPSRCQHLPVPNAANQHSPDRSTTVTRALTVFSEPTVRVEVLVRAEQIEALVITETRSAAGRRAEVYLFGSGGRN
jgi:hypothetical protein